MPGPVKADGTVIKCVNLGWGIFNVEDELSQLIGLPVKAGNDANMAALGEMWQGGGKGYKDIVMVTLGTGVGGGIILNGRMLAGTNGAGGEIGHICVDDDETEMCGCGNKGCLEQYTSATGIVRSAKIILNTTDKPSKASSGSVHFRKKKFLMRQKKAMKLHLHWWKIMEKFWAKHWRRLHAWSTRRYLSLAAAYQKAGDILIHTTEKYFFPVCIPCLQTDKICTGNTWK